MFEANDILNNCYQLQSLLGQTATGHQTWLAVELPCQPVQRFLMQQVRRRLPLVLFDPPDLPKFTIKLLAFSPQIQWEEIKLFEREAEVLKSLNHPQIPRYIDYFETESPRDNTIPWFALVQDYIEGIALDSLLNQNYQFSEKQLKNFAKQVLEILQYLHSLSPPILHRDIKPSNLILGTDNQLYLIDFGAVQAKASVTGLTFTIVGTEGYAPLEQFWGKTVPASDLYALGATLVHLATGIAPADLPHQNSRLQFSDRLNYSQGFIQWLETLTAIAPEQRFPSAEAALSELQYLSIPSLKFFRSSPTAHPPQIEETIPKTAIQIKQNSDSMIINLPNQSTFLPQISWLNYLSLKLKFMLSLLMVSATIIGGFFLQQKQPELLISSGVIISLAIIIKLFKIGQKQSLNFDEKSLKLSKKLLFIPYQIKQEKLEDIIGFFIHQDNHHKYQLSVNTKKTIYFLPPISQAESRWLLQEIHNWLKKQSDISEKDTTSDF